MSRDLSDNENHIAIVIAAGLSSRMGSFKPLLDVGGKPALFKLLDTIKTAGIERVAVVMGYEHETLEAALRDCGDESIHALYNEDYESGMFSSVRTGIRYAAGILSAENTTDAARPLISCPAALLFPVDVPLVAAETIRGLIVAYEQGGASHFAVPFYNGKNGHPLLIPCKYFGEILEYTGEGGLKGVRSRHDSEMIRYEVDDAGCILDMDTSKDYEQILEFEKKHYKK